MNPLLRLVAIGVLTGLPAGAAAQVLEMNADHYGGMLHAMGERPSFEVATIRPSAPNPESRLSGIVMHADRFEFRGSSLKDVIAFAYAVPDEKGLVGGPGWMRTERFDITARPSDAEIAAMKKMSPTNLHLRMRLMMQTLLAQRFKLQTSFAMKDLPMLALVPAKGGLKCRRVAADNAAAFDNPAGPPPPSNTMETGMGRPEEMHWASNSLPFPLIVAWISQQPEVGGRTVVDKTGLNGVFDCKLSWARQEMDAPVPSFFTAMREQMGLSLRPAHGPVETIVIDHLERPSAN